MKFVIDMNLSMGWVRFLEGLGHDAVHWASVGQRDADDEEILGWAAAQDRIVLTNDLDFGMLLMLSGARRPSVVQLRTDQTLPKQAGPLVARAIIRTETDLKSGAIVTVEPGRLRLRSLDADRES